MLDLDKYMLKTLEVAVLGSVVHVKQPSVLLYEQITAAEKGLNSKNLMDKRLDVVKLMLDNNMEGKVFEKESLKTLSRSAMECLISAVSTLRAEVENDPN